VKAKGRFSSALVRSHIRPAQEAGLVQVRGDQICEGEQETLEACHSVFRQETVAPLGDKNGVYNEVGDLKALDAFGNGFDDFPIREHPGFRGVYRKVGRHGFDLTQDEIGRYRPNSLYFLRVLGCQSGDRAHPEPAQDGYRLDVRLDTGPAAGIGPGNGEHAREFKRFRKSHDSLGVIAIPSNLLVC
jgi:hypothetical protein